jgi:hypothetical protein
MSSKIQSIISFAGLSDARELVGRRLFFHFHSGQISGVVVSVDVENDYFVISETKRGSQDFEKGHFILFADQLLGLGIENLSAPR